MRTVLRSLSLLFALAAMSSAQADDRAVLEVTPRSIVLEGPDSSEQLLVFLPNADVGRVDATREARFSLSAPGVVDVSAAGRLTPLADGRAELRITAGGRESTVAIAVRGVASPAPVSFRSDLMPILSKAGCNSGGCHGKAEGQNGFKLSVFGYDPATDFEAIALQARGRRIFPAAPDHSLLLAKATAQIPHGGGAKIERDSRWHKQLRRWIAEGASFDQAAAQPVVGIAVEPAETTLPALGAQQLRVVATDSQGRSRSVTAEAVFQSNNEAIASVDADGLIRATDAPGEAAILVRYLGHVSVCRVTRPRASGPFARPAENNFVDRLVWDKLARLRIPPSGPANDATFLRRVYLDTIGTLPTANEARRFLADQAPDKRKRLAAELLERREYADYWTQRWSDLLQVDKDLTTPQGAVAITRWIHGQLEKNAPYDQFVRAILTAQGSTLGDSPAVFYQVHNDPEKLARSVCQLFLGVRIECAQCHHHPFERWDQHDYFALAGFFTGVQRSPGAPTGMKIVGKAGADLKHPRTGQVAPAAGLGAAPVDFSESGVHANSDRRVALAAWVTSPDNPYFARTIVNRLCAHYLGRGLVEPIDDLRATNPASNEPLLDALAAHLIESRFDLKAVTRIILESQVYQLSAAATEVNRQDEQNYSHALWKPLPAEVLLDAISQATGVSEDFNGWPRGTRAIELWDNKLPSHFLEVFGRPTRQTVCSCERGVEPSVAQALHLMNAPATLAKIQDPGGRAAQLARSSLSDEQIVEELCLATLSRLPGEEERRLLLRAFAEATNRAEAAEDVLWTLVNTKEFVFNH